MAKNTQQKITKKNDLELAQELIAETAKGEKVMDDVRPKYEIFPGE
ncbi:MAG: hypothetical protein H0Z35_01415 [Thermoanaerobacteraceae bacterium]|nr:hypothetical protein [Thermoanaerobacteraceae bacterium]